LAEAETARTAAQKLPDNPAYINLKAQLTNARAEIDLLRHQLKELEVSAAEFRRRIAATPDVEEAYNALISERNNTQAKFDDLMRKHMEASVSQGLEKEQKGERFTLIDPARLPEKPLKPNRLAIMLIGLVLGVGAGIGFAALREFSDDAVHNPDQLELATKFPVLAGIPPIVTRADIVRKRWKRVALATGTIGVIVAGIVVFHLMVMDLNVFWAKLMRKLPI
jgi:capsular polysaccharide biosynthesis protein